MISLPPAVDVERCGAAYIALSAEPWLAIDDPRLVAVAGHFVAITYRASLWDTPIRPIFRFILANGRTVERFAAGPVAGAGIWIGRVPLGTTGVHVSPTNQPGPFAFVIESIRRRSFLSLLAIGFRRNARSTRSAILTRLIHWKPESDVNLAWAIGATRFADYRVWLRQRQRAIDLQGIDAPRFDWTRAPPIQIAIAADDMSGALVATLDSLRQQVFPNWTACVVSPAALALPGDARITQARTAAALQNTAGLVGSLAPGDRLYPHALACIAETAHRHPDCGLFYGDTVIATQDGRLTPLLKPGWSPLLQRQRPYVGRAVFLRTPLTGWTAAERAAFVADAGLPGSVVDTQTVLPIRRAILQTGRPATGPVGTLNPSFRPDASVAIIIPTRDQVAHLRRALASIHRFSDPTTTRVVIVDNGSVEAETLQFLKEAQRSSHVAVMAAPGPFNFSGLCNDAAATTNADVLVFLNNDTEVLDADWLDRLKAWALMPTIGAVGARLTYPDGRLQHIGVCLGMGESAGHFGAFSPPDAVGWAGRHTAVHEVSAVTGACLAVARAKFDAVGGFDAVAMPVELSDIDLCLRLAAHGWTTIVDPGVRLIHAESASRGRATFRRLDVYESQRAFFTATHRAAIRDDPYFHPGLSLYQWTAALG